MTDLADLITVAVCTSPTASDPSTGTIDATIASVRAHEGFVDVWVFIGADGVRPEQRPLREAYAEKVLHAGEYDTRGGIFAMDQWGHQANVIRMLLDQIETPLVLMMEHDTPLTADVPIDWTACATSLLEGGLNSVRFLHESHVLPEHLSLFIDRESVIAESGLIHQRTAQWSQRPHLARVDWYRDLIATYFARSSRTMVEDAMHGVVQYHYRTYGMHGWDRFKLAIYADPEPTMQRSYHLDGRAGGEKYQMLYSYDGETPEGAPAPTLSRVFE